MKKLPPSFFLLSLIFLNIFFVNAQNVKHEIKGKVEYVCMPCGYDCDNQVYDAPGICASCHMPLVKRSTIHFGSIKPAEVCKYIAEHPGVIVLDVRTKEEFEGKDDQKLGTLKNAINIPVQELETKLPLLASYKNKEIIVYCSHSHRSRQASYILTQNGFNKVKNMEGGMSVIGNVPCKK